MANYLLKEFSGEANFQKNGYKLAKNYLWLTVEIP